MGALIDHPDVEQARDRITEQSLIGCALRDGAVPPGIESWYFQVEGHTRIWSAIAGLIEDGLQVSADAVHERLQAAGVPSAVYGGQQYLAQLARCVISIDKAELFAPDVREKAARRQLDTIADELATRAHSLGAAQAAQAAVEALRRVQAAMAPPARRIPQVLDFTALAHRKAPERPWVRAGWLGYEPTLLAGGGGAGKSGLMQHEATCGALGRAYFAPECEPYTSLVWNCEDEHDDLWRRQERICEHEGIDMADLVDRLHIVSRYGCDNALMAEGMYGVLSATARLEELRQQVNDLRVTGLYLDNAAHLLLANHDDRTVVTAFINALAGLVTDRPFFFVIAGHTARAQGSEFSGSAAWENAVRMRLFLGSRLPDENPEEGGEQPRTDVRFLCKRKSNYSALDYVRMTMRGGLLIPDHVPQSHVDGIVAQLDERKAEEVCVAGFEALQRMGLAPTDAKNSPDYLPQQVVVKGLGAGFSKQHLTKAMNRLMARGAFTREVVGQYSNRSPKKGLVFHGLCGE